MSRQPFGEETRSRLLEWSSGQKASERLAGHILVSEGYQSFDPIHPLGGQDGQKDGLARRDGALWIMAAYFPRGQKTFKEIETKFSGDFHGVAANNADGIAFVTNQHLKDSERASLAGIAGDRQVDVFHLDRLTHILNTPQNFGTRLEFLHIEMTGEEQIAFFAWLQNEQKDEIIRSLRRNNDDIIGFTAGGDACPSFYVIQATLTPGLWNVVLFKEGPYPMFDVVVHIQNLTAFQGMVEPIEIDGPTIPHQIVVDHLRRGNDAHGATTLTFELGTVTGQVNVANIPTPSAPAEYMIRTTARNGLFLQKLSFELNQAGKYVFVAGETAKRFFFYPEKNTDAKLKGFALFPRFPSDVEKAFSKQNSE